MTDIININASGTSSHVLSQNKQVCCIIP